MRLPILTSAIAAAWLCVPLSGTIGRAAPPVRHEASRMSMGSAYTIVLYGDGHGNGLGQDREALARVAEEAFDEIDRLDRLMSHYKRDSPLSRLNREAARGPVAVDPELFDVIADAVRYSRASDGAFDITVGPLMKAWGFFRGDGRLPSEADLAVVRPRIGYQHIVLNAANRTIRFDRPGVELDLGGIGKGYAVDRAVAVLKRRGIAAALVSAGGSTIYGLGAPPGGTARADEGGRDDGGRDDDEGDDGGEEGWRVEVQDPLDARRRAMTVRLKDRALSISGSAEKFFEIDGVRYAHIMDPRTGRPVQGILAVAVLTASGMAGDALDNVGFVQGVAWSRAHLAQLHAQFAEPRAEPRADRRAGQRPATELFFFLPDGSSPDGGRGWRRESLSTSRRAGRSPTSPRSPP